MNEKEEIIGLNQLREYRACFVPMCKRNSKNAPDKIFVHVPQDEKRRKKWFQLARRVYQPTKSNLYCCQDHLNIEEDLENYMRFKLYGAPLKLKKDAVPRFFDCQIDRKRAASYSSITRPAYKKLKTRRLLSEILLVDKENTDNCIQEKEEEEAMPQIIEEPAVVATSFTASEHPLAQRSDIIIHGANEMEPLPCTSGSYPLQEINKSNKLMMNKSTQVSNLRAHFRSKGVSCQLSSDCAASTLIAVSRKSLVDSANSPIKFENKAACHHSSTTKTTSSSAIDPTVSTVSEYHPSSDEVKERVEECDAYFKRKALSMTNYFISCNSKRYIGIPADWLWILDHIHNEICMSTDDIKLTLTKIRLNDTFVRLGDQFGISSTQARKIFHKCIIKLANVLKTLIYFSDKESVKRVLPIPFRANYSDVRSIIDAFEIQIEKPSNPVNQALTWSEYKKCNTIKYLISSSPDGKNNFISKGYGGRVSDRVLFETCGIMDKLPENCAVMADRGFKQIETVLSKKNCKLIRPPSVSSSVKPSKSQVLETKRIASLRIHIERVIRRIREFKMLVPHACVNHCIIPIIDHVITICAGLINIQTPIIRT